MLDFFFSLISQTKVSAWTETIFGTEDEADDPDRSDSNQMNFEQGGFWDQGGLQRVSASHWEASLPTSPHESSQFVALVLCLKALKAYILKARIQTL